MNTPAAARFGRRIAAARKEQGWTLEELSAKTGVAPPQLSYVERGTRGCLLDTAVRIAVAAGVSLDGLLDPCRHCGDSPPGRFICPDCGASGPGVAS